MSDARRLARVFKALSVETRVRIVQALRSRSLCVNALARELGITPAAVSQHLRVLRDAGVVEAERRGYYVHYRVSDEVLSEWQRMAVSLLGGGGCPGAAPGCSLPSDAQSEERPSPEETGRRPEETRKSREER